ncbi:MAG TPA: PilZ domain-containing protein [Spirochaetes bacterium]|nr:PilZ domain-containing protein [Spirochaetota bacterium]
MEIEAFRITAPTTGQYIILLVVVVVIGAAFFIAAVKMGVTKRRPGRSSGTGWHDFYQIAKMRTLSKKETAVLKKLVISRNVANPTLIFTSATILDSCIQRAVRRLTLQETKDESNADLINMYYRLRNKISRGRSGRIIRSTRGIDVGVRMRLGTQDYGYFTTHVVKNVTDYLSVSIPVLPQGKTINWARKKVKCSFWRENDAVYVFDSKVIDVVITEELKAICLRHTYKIARIQKRLYPRKNVRLPVFFSKMRIITEGGKKKALVDKKETHWGTIIDISVGGLSIETTAPVGKNNFVRVDFELREGYKVLGYGKVKRIERDASRKTWVMNIQTTKMDKKYKNEIFAVLYNYQTL